MKRKLHLLRALCCFGLLSTGFAVNAQINYSEGFEGATTAWSDDDFESVSLYACTGTNIFVGEAFSFFGLSFDAATQAAIGTSNGMPATLTYNYKLLDYYTEEGLLNSPNWGSITVAYATSVNGPWTTVQTITPANHVVSDDCAAKTVTFSPPAGAVYLQFTAHANENEEIDYYLLFDDVAVTQAPSVACSGTPAASAAVAASASICNSQSASLSLSPAYLASGLTYQWQSSQNGTTFTNVATGGTGATYTAAQTASTWYRAIITCGAGGDAVTSSPVQVINTGLNCLCDVVFEEDIEPITNVEFAGISNTSSATINGTPGVQNFTALAPGQVTVGQTYAITLQGNTNDPFEDGYESFFTVYFDWNHNGDLSDDGENYDIDSIIYSTGEDDVEATAQIMIPANAMAGLTYMRVVKLYDAYSDDPCSSEAGYGYGQVEDYLINVSLPPCTTPAPEAPPLQVVCSGSTVADLEADGNIIEWYAAATGGMPITEETPLVNGTIYYAAQTPENGCESVERTAVTAQFSIIPPPDTDNDIQVFCDSGTVADLDVIADGDVTWYATETGGTAISEDTALVDGTVYYASQSVDGCESTTRTDVTVVISVVSAPTGEATQIFSIDEGQEVTIADIVIEAEGSVTWYASEEDLENGNAINVDTYTIPIGSTVTLYAVQMIGDCVSEPFAVTVTAVLGSKGFTKGVFTYYPNPVKDVFTLNYTQGIDAIEVYNLLGQQVFKQAVNQNEARTHLSVLAKGTYMIKVYSGNEQTIIKVVKQ